MERVMEQSVMERSVLRVAPLTPGLMRDYAVATGVHEAVGRVETAIGRLGTGNTYVRTHLA